MMPNVDPRALKRMMESMGMKSTEINADKVVIFCNDKEITISDPSVTRIDMQGNVSFQVSGPVSETRREEGSVEITDDDVKMVVEKTGATEGAAKAALERSGGDIASAILDITSDK